MHWNAAAACILRLWFGGHYLIFVGMLYIKPLNYALGYFPSEYYEQLIGY